MLPSIEEIQANTSFPVNYFIVVLHGESVVHITAYENQPGEVDIDHLGQELMTDDEFGLTDVNIEELVYMIFTDKGYEDFLNDVEYEQPCSTSVQ